MNRKNVTTGVASNVIHIRDAINLDVRGTKMETIHREMNMEPEIELYFGKPTDSNYFVILDQLSGTKYNSYKTSSIPLAQYWKQYKKALKKLSNGIMHDFVTPKLCFEFPTESGSGIGKSSMTDLMIIDGLVNVAIEAKYTEYLSRESELLKKWIKSGNEKNRANVLNSWLEMIGKFESEIVIDDLMEVDYQFIHRTASACKMSDKPYVVYQVFYDRVNENKKDEYIKKLKTYESKLNNSKNIDFYCWEVEVNLIIEENKQVNPFILMKEVDVYKFGKDKIYRL
jgi:hypothetical protein